MTATLAVLDWSAIGLRAGVVAGSLILWFWTQSLIARRSAPKEGIGDVVHDLTASWHKHLVTHPRAANATLIVSSIFIDLLGLMLIGAAIFGSTFSPFLGILILFALRQACQVCAPCPRRRASSGETPDSRPCWSPTTSAMISSSPATRRW